MEDRVVLHVVGAMHVRGGNQHLGDQVVALGILIITDAHIVTEEVRQWGIKGVAALIECPNVEGILEIKPVFKVLQLWRALWSFAFYAILLRDILTPVGQCHLIEVSII